MNRIWVISRKVNESSCYMQPLGLSYMTWIVRADEGGGLKRHSNMQEKVSVLFFPMKIMN